MENQHIVIGYLGSDPETSYTKDGTAKTLFTVATTERWKDKNGEAKEATEWHNVEAWGHLAEVCGQHLKKGRLVYVQGSHHTDRWETDQGEKRMRHYIRPDKVKFLNSTKGKE
ncbi:MAG: single-stranded DNA-binding protein [Desulfobacteraceae bacterium]|nr:single-stranded DNA-binding protein [Desulfobacteraceae bacterium]